MSKQGWYPDPGGQAGWFRYWNGTAWSQETTRDPADPPPGTQRVARGSRTSAPAFAPVEKDGRGGSGVIWLVVLALVLALIAFLGIRAANGGGPPFGPRTDRMPSMDVCPKPVLDNTPEPHPADGRVHGGKISYPRLGDPWTAPYFDDRVPFGADVREQTVLLERNYNGHGNSWVASVLVGDLVAGDGFYSPEKGTDIVAHCVLGTFYGDAKVERKDVAKHPVKIDGHDAYQLEMHLSFDIKGLRTKGETAIIIVVSTGPSTAALFYASVPDTAPEHLTTARALIPQLRIGS